MTAATRGLRRRFRRVGREAADVGGEQKTRTRRVFCFGLFGVLSDVCPVADAKPREVAEPVLTAAVEPDGTAVEALVSTQVGEQAGTAVAALALTRVGELDGIAVGELDVTRVGELAGTAVEALALTRAEGSVGVGEQVVPQAAVSVAAVGVSALVEAGVGQACSQAARAGLEAG
jgi:hypothetical protein